MASCCKSHPCILMPSRIASPIGSICVEPVVVDEVGIWTPPVLPIVDWGTHTVK